MKWYLPDSSVAGSGYYQVDGAYGALFSADLAYQQIEGSVIGGRQQLRDIALRFHRRHNVAWHFSREDLKVEADEVIETILQLGTKERAASTVKRVQVFSEEIRSSGWRVGSLVAKYTEIASGRRNDGGAGPKRDTVHFSEIRIGTIANRTYPGRLARSRRTREGRSG